MNELATGTRIETLPETRGGWITAVAALWIAVAAITGYLHGAELVIARAAGTLAWFSREFIWMAPASYAIVMLPGAVVLAVVCVVARRRWALSLSACAFVTVGAFGLLLPYTQLSRTSALIFALGIGVAAARAMHARPATWMRRGRLTAVFCAVATLVIAPAQRLLRSAGESRAVGTLGTPPSDAVNVLFIILDTVRAASMGLYNSAESTTPRLQEWARSSTVFEWAFSPSSWTLPSHGSMFTGAWANELSGDWEVPLNDSLPTIAERLRDRGYLTSAFVGNLHYTAWDSGLLRGFNHFEGYSVNWEQLLLSSSYTQTTMFDRLLDARSMSDVFGALRDINLSIDRKHRFSPRRATAITDGFLEWQTSASQRPFFAFLNYYDAHQRRYAPPAFRRFEGANGRGQYRASIAYLDAEIDRLLTTLRERGVLDNTLVVVTSDHGELFGFKGFTGHAHNVYLNTIHVPLLVRLPGRVPQGVRVTQPVTLRDIAATILDLTATTAEVPGTSLRATWEDSAQASPVLAEVRRAPNIAGNLPTSRGTLQSLIDSHWQLIRHEANDSLELYDYRVDIEHDLAHVDSIAGVLAAMRQRLADLLRTHR